MAIRTAEFISPKHPDKLCDRISDSILYEYVKGDKNSRCAIETCGGHSKIFITGEITSKTEVTDTRIKEIVSQLTGIEDIIIHIHQQSPRIAQGVDGGGAGDQGIMIGYACNENDELVPQEYYLARQLNRFIYGKYPFDGKTQITLDDNDVRVVASFQNAPKEDLKILVEDFFTQYPKYNIVELHCNPAGDWEIGSFEADAGVTGRKLATDNYGPRVPLGGGAFSGKDMARKIAVDYLKKYDAKEVKVELSYAIGHDRPIQATAIITYDSGWGKDVKYISDYDLSPNGIIKYLNLKDIDYSETAKWGHMGLDFPWN